MSRPAPLLPSRRPLPGQRAHVPGNSPCIRTPQRLRAPAHPPLGPAPCSAARVTASRVHSRAPRAARECLPCKDKKNLLIFFLCPAEKLRKLAQDGYKRFEGFEYDVEADIKAYEEMAATVKPFIADTVHQINQWSVFFFFFFFYRAAFSHSCACLLWAKGEAWGVPRRVVLGTSPACMLVCRPACRPARPAAQLAADASIHA